MKFTTVTLLACAASLVAGDLYMQNPRGNNNRHSEENGNRDNANRLFDSQNNGAGGYCWGPAMSFYEGSILSIEWTSQHGCGQNPKLYCSLVVQYMCTDDDADPMFRVRDGSGDTTDTPDVDPSESTRKQDGELLYGINEPYSFRVACEARQRNKGLYIADRGVGESAATTRQNNGGNRHGYECPEERDYWPYWHPSPWMDIAVLTHNEDWCKFYKDNSQNVLAKNFCIKKGTKQSDFPYGDSQFNNEKDCNGGGDKWVEFPEWKLAAPDCVIAPYSRDNHLGNGQTGFANSYNWTLPRASDANDNNPLKCIADDKCNCVLRLRYNISTGDVADTDPHNPSDKFLDWTYNANNSPIKGNPTVKVDGRPLELAVDTTQFGRVFQDRSFVFHIKPRKDVSLAARIHNLNVRGKRGNIVQTYPATEYDFVPQYLKVRVSDYVHFQWTGCDNNPNGNAGEGTSQTDRSNIVQMADSHSSVPVTDDWVQKNPDQVLFTDQETRMNMAYLGQKGCLTRDELNTKHNNDANAIEEDPANCMKLNAADRHFDGGLVKMNSTGSFFYMSTRNNNFSNRGQKGGLEISSVLPVWAIVVVVGGAVGFAGSAAVAGAMLYARAHPHSAVAAQLSKF